MAQEEMTVEEFNALLGKRKDFAPTAKPERGGPNKTERAFGLELAMRKSDGHVLWFAFQPVTFKLAHDCRFTPDYMMALPDAAIEFVDVKGRKGDGYWCEEDAKIKIRVAADKFPMFRFSIQWPCKDGGWGREEFRAIERIGA